MRARGGEGAYVDHGSYSMPPPCHRLFFSSVWGRRSQPLPRNPSTEAEGADGRRDGETDGGGGTNTSVGLSSAVGGGSFRVTTLVYAQRRERKRERGGGGGLSLSSPISTEATLRLFSSRHQPCLWSGGGRPNSASVLHTYTREGARRPERRLVFHFLILADRWEATKTAPPAWTSDLST